MREPLKIAVIDKSDSTGGAAIVSRRLTEALRKRGADARMFVCEKLTDLPFVELCAPQWQIKEKFLAERAEIFLSTGFNRETLFKIDTGSEGLPLWRHPFVKECDVVLLNWINQGMLSLKGIRKILELGKPVVWTMHDMWCMTGICHHAGSCTHFHDRCGCCPLLGKKSSPKDLSEKIWEKKNSLYGATGNSRENLKFVAVSRWLKAKCHESSLLRAADIRVIPNPFHPVEKVSRRVPAHGEEIRILFGAARLDDPIKGFETFAEMTAVLAEKYPEIARRLKIITFGNIKDPSWFSRLALSHRHLGVLRGEEALRDAYTDAHILVSSSEYETLPGTLVEAQAYGCIPVSLDRGGQSDIITHRETGWLAPYADTPQLRGANLAEGVVWASEVMEEPERYAAMTDRMYEDVNSRFSEENVARQYIRLIESMNKKT